MARAFLSHSSADKKRYVEKVFQLLGPSISVYDNYTFEEGMLSFEEINKGLSISDVFVLLLSDTALNSRWVKTEISKAYDLLKDGKLERIFPILIDSTINHRDKRIPKWLREEYNLKFISRPTIAARRIEQRLREISWKNHPRLLEKEKIFKGRNELISTFEERIDSHEKDFPTCFIASGLKGVGRRALLKFCFKKSNLIEESYRPPIISMGTQDSVEDFLLKIYNLGFSENIDLTNLLSKSIDTKVSIANSMIKDLQSAKEILFIEDSGSIINKDGDIIPWFLKIFENLEIKNVPTFAIASQNRLQIHNYRSKEQIFFFQVPELDRKDRLGLFKRYLDFEELSLDRGDFEIIGGLLHGYPDQIFYAVELIKDTGIQRVKRESYVIVEFNSQRSIQVLQKYESNPKALDLIVLLSSFEFISNNLLAEIIGNDSEYVSILYDLTISSVVEYLGASKEHIRINDTIRDYVSRTRIPMNSVFSAKLKTHLEGFLQTYTLEEKDVSDTLYSIKQALLLGKNIDERYIIPSHFLKTIKELYDIKKDYRQVISLSDRVMESESTIDEKIYKEIRYYLCMALARERSDRFLTEVHKISGIDHLFLMGFYYRIKGRYNEAINKFKEILEIKQYPPARRELVNVYILLEDYDLAKDLAKRNFEASKSNPFHIQAYFECISHDNSDTQKDAKLKDLIDRLKILKTDVAKEMGERLQAKYYAYVLNDPDSALFCIEEAIKLFPENIYTRLTKFDICEKYHKVPEMEKVVSDLSKLIGDSNYYQGKLAMMEAKCLVLRGQQDAGIELIRERLKSHPDNIVKSMIRKLKK